MKILPVIFNNQTSYKTPKKVNFKAHPDFNILKRDYDVIASSFFRRGRCYGSPSKRFIDVENCLRQIFRNLKGKKTMLIAGIGESQEPFSELAVIKDALEERSLNKSLDLHVIDLQSKPGKRTLFRQSFYNSPFEPDYVPGSFVKDDGLKYGFRAWMKYRVNDEIFKFLNSTYKNPQKSLWDTRLQEAVKEYPAESFDVISINNTIGYIRDNDVIVETMKNIMRILKRDGTFITDPISDFNEVIRNSTTELYEGIFRKR
jgi:hypothetical protein